MVQLELEEVNIKYGNFHAVKGVSLNVKSSEIVTLLGPSGCGKTSLLRAVAGFTLPSEGKIYVDGEDITNLPPQKRDMGMIFQNYALWPHMSISDNIGYGLKIRKVPREEREKKIIDMVKKVNLLGHQDKFPAQLSGGQQQRVALARALVIDPKILLCDEPLSNLDFGLRVELRNEIRDIAKQFGVTVAYVTHDQTEALAISDKVAIIDEGLIIQEGTPLNIFSNPESLFVGKFVGENNTLNGVIHSIDDVISVKLDSGEILKTDVSKNGISVGDNVSMITRFNDLIFNPKELDNKINGTLKYSAFMGEFIQIEIELADSNTITVNIKENIDDLIDIKTGSKVSVRIPPSSLFVFKDEKRIR